MNLQCKSPEPLSIKAQGLGFMGKGSKSLEGIEGSLWHSGAARTLNMKLRNLGRAWVQGLCRMRIQAQH